jgi:hypothetical protein
MHHSESCPSPEFAFLFTKHLISLSCGSQIQNTSMTNGAFLILKMKSQSGNQCSLTSCAISGPGVRLQFYSYLGIKHHEINVSEQKERKQETR